MKRWKDKLAALAAAALLATGAWLWLAGEGGGQAPDIDLLMLDGSKLRLGTLRGRPVLVTFWATTCVGCRREVPHLIELYEKYHPRGFELLAVAMSYDPPVQVARFKKEKQLPYRIALDVDGAAARAFGGVRLTPTTFVIARDGRIVFQKIGEFEVGPMHRRIERLLAEPAPAGSATRPAAARDAGP